MQRQITSDPLKVNSPSLSASILFSNRTSISNESQSKSKYFLKIDEEIIPRDTHCIAISLDQKYLYQSENGRYDLRSDIISGSRVIIYTLKSNTYCGGSLNWRICYKHTFLTIKLGDHSKPIGYLLFERICIENQLYLMVFGDQAVLNLFQITK